MTDNPFMASALTGEGGIEAKVGGWGGRGSERFGRPHSFFAAQVYAVLVLTFQLFTWIHTSASNPVSFYIFWLLKIFYECILHI
jgi:hypothetical protein